MTYIVQRKDRFYVVAYDGLDPLTSKERRRWHPAGHDRAEAEAIAGQLATEQAGSPPRRGGPIEFRTFLLETWLPQKRHQVRSTTGYRYAWMVHRYVIPALGQVPLRRLRADHLDGPYESLTTTGGKHGTGLAPKTVHEVHMIVRAALDLAVRRGLLDRTWRTPPSLGDGALPRPLPGSGPLGSSPRSWPPPGPSASTPRSI